jgi:DNA polymerase I-like protein with 3'-5' exonuclease and polymerase domains
MNGKGLGGGEAGKEVRRQYAENPHLDFHQYVVDLTGLSRKYAKNMSFGVSFGMGLPSMAESFGWTMEQAEEISEKYHEHMPFVKPTLALVGDVAKERGYIKTVCGSHARLPDPKKSYTMLNRYTQGSGAECLKSAIIQAYREGIWRKLRVANTVHDELNMPYLEPTEESMLALYRMAEIMRTAVPSLRVPLEASPELGDNWASTKEVTEWIKLRDEGDEAWNKASDSLKKAVNICDTLLKEGKVSA